MMASYKNGFKTLEPELGVGVVKVVVMGQPEVGKTTFIRAYYDHHEPGDTDSHEGIRWFPCEFEIDGEYWRTKIFEIPGDPRFALDQKKTHYKYANVIVLMYTIEDPLSLELLTDRWLPEAEKWIKKKKIPVVVVGNKKDLRNDPEVVERLALNGEEPLTYEQAVDWFKDERIKDLREVSSKNSEEVNDAFRSIFRIAVEAMRDTE